MFEENSLIYSVFCMVAGSEPDGVQIQPAVCEQPSGQVQPQGEEAHTGQLHCGLCAGIDMPFIITIYDIYCTYWNINHYLHHILQHH